MNLTKEEHNLPKYSQLAQSLKIDGKYEHYSGKQYRLIGIARHTETLEELVVYQALYGDMNIWVRPLKMFCEEVEIGGQMLPRFKRLA